MENAIKRSIIYSLLLLFAMTVGTILHNIVGQLIMLIVVILMSILIIKNLIAVFVLWKQYNLKSILPVSICLLSIVIYLAVISQVNVIASKIVLNNKRNEYEKVINMFETGELIAPLETTKRVELPINLNHLAYAVHAKRYNTGQLVVDFFTGGGFPVKHCGYLYSSDGSIPPESTRKWKIIYKVDEHWFRVAD